MTAHTLVLSVQRIASVEVASRLHADARVVMQLDARMVGNAGRAVGGIAFTKPTVGVALYKSELQTGTETGCGWD